MIDGQVLPKRNLPRDVFLHLLAIITLYWSAVSFIMVMFQHVNYYFQDKALGDPLMAVQGLLRFALASLIIVFPIFFFVSYFLERLYDREPLLREMKLRKWLIYFTLFVAAIVIIVDLVRVILVYLQGGMNLQFILQMASLFFVAALIFGYYLNEVRAENNKFLAKTLVWLSGVLVLAGIVSTFFIIGSPKEARFKEYDQRKVSDLQSIQYLIANYWQRKETLPASLADLSDQISGSYAPVDPQTKAAYEYRIIDAKNLKFELCANFSLPGASLPMIENPAAIPASIPGKSIDSQTWDHGAGRVCFERTIDKDLYPLLNKQD
ncbi:MAG: DUF5671 domain-containing protein [Parcubacteria group bacterium]